MQKSTIFNTDCLQAINLIFNFNLEEYLNQFMINHNNNYINHNFNQQLQQFNDDELYNNSQSEDLNNSSVDHDLNVVESSNNNLNITDLNINNSDNEFDADFNILTDAEQSELSLKLEIKAETQLNNQHVQKFINKLDTYTDNCVFCLIYQTSETECNNHCSSDCVEFKSNYLQAYADYKKAARILSLFTALHKHSNLEIQQHIDSQQHTKYTSICSQCFMSFKVCFAFRNTTNNKNRYWLINELPAFLYVIFRLKQFEISAQYYFTSAATFDIFANYITNKVKLFNRYTSQAERLVVEFLHFIDNVDKYRYYTDLSINQSFVTLNSHKSRLLHDAEYAQLFT